MLGCQEVKKPFLLDKINTRKVWERFFSFSVKELHKMNLFPQSCKLDTSTLEEMMKASSCIQHELKIIADTKRLNIVIDSIRQYAENCLTGDTLHLAVENSGRTLHTWTYYTFFSKINDTLFNEIRFSYCWSDEKKHYVGECNQTRIFIDLHHNYIYDYCRGKEKRNFVKEKRKNEHTLGFGDYQAYFRFVRLPNDSVKLDDMALYLY